MNRTLKTWPAQCPFELNILYLPAICSPLQIELLTHATLLYADVFSHQDYQYLLVSSFPGKPNHTSTTEHRASLPHALSDTSVNFYEMPFRPSKWLPIPDGYDLPCYLDRSLRSEGALLLQSPAPRTFWRCRSSDYVEYAFNHGGQWFESTSLLGITG